DVQLIGVDDGDDTAHVRVALEERPATTLDLSTGFSTQQFFSLRLEGRDRNLFGSMFDGSAAVDMGLFIGRYSQVRNQIRWPRIFGSDFTLTYTPLALSYLDQPSGLILTSPSTGGGQKALTTWDQPDFRRRLFTASTSIGIEWRAADIAPIIDDKLTIGFAIEARGDWLEIAGRYYEPLSGEAFRSVDGLADLFVGDTAIDPITIIAFTPRIAWSNIDNPFDPLHGYGAEFFVRMVPFAREPYSVIGTQLRGYWSFAEDRITLATGFRLRAGIIGDSDRCPATEPRCQWAVMQNDLLRLGGERSVRGVGENQVGVFGTLLDQQLAPALNDDGTPSAAIRPGLFGAVANVELRFTLIRQLFLGDLKPAIFSDVGISTDDFAFGGFALNDQRYAVSLGAGLRYVLPVGPLAFDVAWSPFDQQAATIPLRYSLTLGYIF
ncbi:MAG TPA: BamA/TamA family outer membrane protein, partial [Myxococcota bacterium]